MADTQNIIPHGYCQCGCSQKPTVPQGNNRSVRYVRGQPMRFILGHNSRGAGNPKWNGGRKKSARGYINIWTPGHPNADSHGCVYEHRLVCEKALGKYLPDGTMPHHVNGIEDDNRPENLVLCQNQAYHLLLHLRKKALKSCGHASWRKCWICKQWDNPNNLYINKRSVYHHDCRNQYKRDRYASMRLVLSGPGSRYFSLITLPNPAARVVSTVQALKQYLLFAR